jgi:16S rRNA (adenine1518-N6/adenine1519-N6)-dimethyltransferase
MSILSVAVQLEYTAKDGIFVPAKLFTPPPKVDSSLLILTRLEKQLFDGLDKKRFMRVVKAGFSAKRKMLRNTISAGLEISKAEADELLAKAGIDSSRRAETLSLKEWHKVFTQSTDAG